MKVFINKETRIGYGSCEAICPKIFEIKDGKSSVKLKEINDSELKCVKEAISSCPTNSISVK